MKEAILIFDIPLDNKSDARKVQRDLNGLNAKMIQKSVWKSANISQLIDIATFIKKIGGTATILEEKLIF